MAGYNGKPCDICGKTDTYLYGLQHFYATDDIKEICTECQNDVTEQLKKLQDITFKQNEHWLKKFMANMKSKFTSGDKEG
jgi:hypothetical protein